MSADVILASWCKPILDSCNYLHSKEPGPAKNSNKRLLIGIVSGITLVLIVVAAVLMAVFLGAKVTKESQKVKTMFFYLPCRERIKIGT